MAKGLAQSCTERLGGQVALGVDKREPLDREHVIFAEEDVHNADLALAHCLVHNAGYQPLGIHIYVKRRRKKVVWLAAAHKSKGEERLASHRTEVETGGQVITPCVPVLALEDPVRNLVDGLLKCLGLVANPHVLDLNDHIISAVAFLRLDAAGVPHGGDDIPCAVLGVVGFAVRLAQRRICRHRLP